MLIYPKIFGYSLAGPLLKGHVVILLHRTPVHSATERFVGTWQPFGKEWIVIIGVHFGLEFERGIKIVQIIEFTQMAHEFQSYVLQAPVSMFRHNKFGLPHSW